MARDLPRSTSREVTLEAIRRGDFWQTWHNKKLRQLVRRCFGGEEDCGTFDAGD
ncbi:MAG TPA: hypothetical protein VF108_00965 [Actinomycetota bacterium]